MLKELPVLKHEHTLHFISIASSRRIMHQLIDMLVPFIWKSTRAGFQFWRKTSTLFKLHVVETGNIFCYQATLQDQPWANSGSLCVRLLTFTVALSKWTGRWQSRFYASGLEFSLTWPVPSQCDWGLYVELLSDGIQLFQAFCALVAVSLAPQWDSWAQSQQEEVVERNYQQAWAVMRSPPPSLSCCLSLNGWMEEAISSRAERQSLRYQKDTHTVSWCLWFRCQASGLGFYGPHCINDPTSYAQPMSLELDFVLLCSPCSARWTHTHR